MHYKHSINGDQILLKQRLLQYVNAVWIKEKINKTSLWKKFRCCYINNLYQLCECGDKITCDGICLLKLNTGGFAGMLAGLTTNTYLHCMHISKENNGFDIDEQDEVHQIAIHPQIYDKLSRAMVPEIYGLEDVNTDQMKIRGDITIIETYAMMQFYI